MKASHEDWVAKQLNAASKDFFVELQRIFQQCDFDDIFMQQSFNVPFPDCFFDKIDEGCYRIRDFLNDECALSLRTDIRREIYSFTQLIDYTLTGIVIGSRYNGSGFASPRYTKQDADAIANNVKLIQSEYEWKEARRLRAKNKVDLERT